MFYSELCQHILSTYTLNIYSQHILWTYTLNIYSQHILSTYNLNIYSQYILSTYTVDIYSQHILSTYTLNIYSQHILSTYTVNLSSCLRDRTQVCRQCDVNQMPYAWFALCGDHVAVGSTGLCIQCALELWRKAVDLSSSSSRLNRS
jgi:hypothetical protein